MSLLIKALDNAEKNKQAEKDKKRADGTQPAETSPVEPTSSGLELSLEEISPATPVDLSISTGQPAPSAQAASEELALTDNFADSGLSLEEEAGLSPPPASKYSKPKPAENKSAKENKSTSAKSSDVKTASQSTTKATAGSTNLPPVFQALAAQASERSSDKTQIENNQQTAAKVFVANQPARANNSKAALLLLGVAGALMIWLGLQGYGYIKTLLAPDVVVVKPVSPPINLEQTQQPVEVADATVGGFDPNAAPSEPTQSVEPAASTPPNAASEVLIENEAEKANNEKLAQADEKIQALMSEPVLKKSTRKQSAPSLVEDSDAEPASKRAPVKLVSKAPTVGVDPTLLSAYQAFTRGEDASAQQQYRQVLQKDVRNTDALLGMAAIAQRQGRNADAAGWYQKVLEIEPRNSLAQSALVATQVNSDSAGAESRIKNMIALQPDGAHLHAALGNAYAEQNQWSLAQESYFNASRLAPNNADYAFNLAISLDQLGKRNLALQQYQRALDLLNISGASSPDRTQLEARIQALQ